MKDYKKITEVIFLDIIERLQEKKTEVMFLDIIEILQEKQNWGNVSRYKWKITEKYWDNFQYVG